MHYSGCGSQRGDTRFCPCGEVDHMIRLSADAQVDAAFEAESFLYQEDYASNWYVYLRSIGWTDEQVCGQDSRPEYADETLMRCQGIVYSCFV